MDVWLEDILEKFDDHDVDEILINSIYSLELVSGNSKKIEASPFKSKVDLTRSIQDFSFSQGLRLDPVLPANGGMIASTQYRWHAIIPPAACDGPLFSVRRHRFANIELTDFLFADKSMALYLENAFRMRLPMLICGPTGSGKSTLLSSLLKKCSLDERVIILEKILELSTHKNWIRLVAQPISIQTGAQITLKMLFEESLRIRPDRLIIGEIRGDEIGIFFELISSGHGGAAATIHASSLDELEIRIIKMMLNCGYSSEYIKILLLSLDQLVCVFLDRGNPPTVKQVSKFKNKLDHL
ncbi:MAG: ATPase, T2SS/T4P/T4SS family [Bdellovibrionota bacterium]